MGPAGTPADGRRGAGTSAVRRWGAGAIARIAGPGAARRRGATRWRRPAGGPPGGGAPPVPPPPPGAAAPRREPGLDHAHRDRRDRVRLTGTEDRRPEALHALRGLLVVDRVAALARRPELPEQRRDRRDTVPGQPRQRLSGEQRPHLLFGQRAQHGLARRSARGREAAADPEVDRQRPGSLPAGQVGDVGAVEDREHHGLGGERGKRASVLVEGAQQVRLAREGVRPLQRLHAERKLAVRVASCQPERDQRRQQPVHAALGQPQTAGQVRQRQRPSGTGQRVEQQHRALDRGDQAAAVGRGRRGDRGASVTEGFAH